MCELSAVIAGLAEGCTGPEQVTLFKSFWIAVDDVAAARSVYDRAVARRMGVTLHAEGGRRDAAAGVMGRAGETRCSLCLANGLLDAYGIFPKLASLDRLEKSDEAELAVDLIDSRIGGTCSLSG